MSVRDLCERAGVACKASGAWCDRQVAVEVGEKPSVDVCPGYLGSVRVTVPKRLSERDGARWALGALAYCIFDGVARASIAGTSWSRPARPVGRPRLACAKSNAERQRLWRNNQASSKDGS